MVKNEVSIYDKYHQSHEKKKKKNIHIDKIWEHLIHYILKIYFRLPILNNLVINPNPLVEDRGH